MGALAQHLPLIIYTSCLTLDAEEQADAPLVVEVDLPCAGITPAHGVREVPGATMAPMGVVSPVLLVALVVVLASGASAVWFLRIDRRMNAALDRIEVSADEMDAQLRRQHGLLRTLIEQQSEMKRLTHRLVDGDEDEVTLPGPRRAAD